jgi:hypothetical protein
MNFRKLFLATTLLPIVFFSFLGCKKDDTTPLPATTQDQLAANKWQSEKVSFTAVATYSGIEIPVQNQENLIDSLVLEFKKDNNLAIYNKSKNNVLTKLSEQPYNLNNTTREISISSLQSALVSPELQTLLNQLGLTLPTTAKITTITTTQLVLTSVINANLKASDLSTVVTFPFPIPPSTIIPFKVNIITTFKNSSL